MNRIRLYTDDNYKYNTSSPDAQLVLQGVYFDGHAETILGHDIICIPKDVVIAEGLHPFEVIDSTHGHQILTGTLYIWDGPFFQRGLAVTDGDSDGHLYAQRCFNEKKKYL